MFDELISILNEINIPYAYNHFAQGEVVEPPFICYLVNGSDNFAADGLVYFKINEIHIELYTDCKNPSLESQIEDVLFNHQIFYEKQESHIKDENMYEVLYIFELEDK